MSKMSMSRTGVLSGDRRRKREIRYCFGVPRIGSDRPPRSSCRFHSEALSEEADVIKTLEAALDVYRERLCGM